MFHSLWLLLVALPSLALLAFAVLFFGVLYRVYRRLGSGRRVVR